MRISGAVALITGGGAGIGRAAAALFAKEGAAVVILDRDEASAAAVTAEIRASGGRALALAADVTREDEVAGGVRQAVEAFGPITVLFNCAGGSLAEDDVVSELEPSVWDRTVAVDLTGTFLVCRAVLPHMQAAGRGSIVNMSSGAALRGAGTAHAYAAAKGGILSLTRALAGRYARDGIRANAICSGRILTDRIIGRYGRPGQPGPFGEAESADERVSKYPFWMGSPEDIAGIALFLASEESRMITGAAIPADGGRSAY